MKCAHEVNVRVKFSVDGDEAKDGKDEAGRGVEVVILEERCSHEMKMGETDGPEARKERGFGDVEGEEESLAAVDVLKRLLSDAAAGEENHPNSVLPSAHIQAYCEREGQDCVGN